MGCDIHFFVEKLENDRWVSADEWYTDPDQPNRLSTTDWANYKWGVGADNRGVGRAFYSGRNYNLFAILANVRNGRGFAGVPTGTGFQPISLPRGLPDDVSPEVKLQADHWDGDGHSHSWHRVSDLIAYDWTQETVLTGSVSLGELAKLRVNGTPDSWSGSTSGPGIREFAAEDVVPIIDAILERTAPYPSGRKVDWYTLYHLEEGYMIGRPRAASSDAQKRLDYIWSELTRELGCELPVFRAMWRRSYSECCGEFLSNTMPRLWRLGRPEDVRIVFWFDN